MPATDGHSKPVGSMELGDHLCLLFDSDAERRSVMAAYVRDGVRAGQKVIYISDAVPARDVAAWLGGRDGGPDTVRPAQDDTGFDFAAAADAGHFAVRTAEETFLASGRFDPDESLELMATEIDLALVQTLGLNSLIYTLIGYGAGRLRELRDPQGALVPIATGAAATAIERISASSAAMRETAKPMTFDPVRSRCTSVLLSAIMVSNSPSPHPRWKEAPWIAARLAASRGFAISTTGAEWRRRFDSHAIMRRTVAPAARHWPAWHRGRADRWVGPALCSG